MSTVSLVCVVVFQNFNLLSAIDGAAELFGG